MRPAGPADAAALGELERAANVVALAHVFPPTAGDFPLAEVVERWAVTLADPSVRVEVLDGPAGAGLDAFTAYDGGTLRHLAVHPRAWGRGLARQGVERAVVSIRAGGAVPRLWCLVANERALGLYAHLGWRATGVERASQWPPYPCERELVLPSGAGGPGGGLGGSGP